MAKVFRAVNGSPSENMEKVLAMMGGAERLFGDDDIVIIKPNLQWFNQGAPNIAAVEALITLIMEKRGGFKGEVVIAENVHRGSRPWETGGWHTDFDRNSDLPGIKSYNGLADRLKKAFGDRFSVCHLIDVGSGGKRVYSPPDGPGYVLCDGSGGIPLLAMDNGLPGLNKREVIMSYPIIRTDKGTIIDYRWGAWEKDSYTPQPVKFINCAALNHHSQFCGMTSSVKNYLGVSDLSGGSSPIGGGKLVDHYHNFHSFAFNWSKKGPVPGMLGAEVGYFLKTVRRPYLNITTAEFCGLIDRTNLPVAHTKAIAASTDPVALDFHMARYVLYPNSHVSVHDSEAPKSPTRQSLDQCARTGGYCIDEKYVEIKSFDFSTHSFQADKNWVIRAETQWGGDIKSLMKYAVFRLNLVS
ncbi:MAG: hypothetical protein ABSG19_00760 [Candidatus Aminicenantales bacterium]